MNHTAIEWADYTSNPVRAIRKSTGKRGWFCTKVSAGCANCYSERMNMRCSPDGRGIGNGLAYTTDHENLVDFVLDGQELRRLADKRPKAKPRRVFTGQPRCFVGDMTDLFHDRIPDSFRLILWAMMQVNTSIVFMILTKRPPAMLDFYRRIEENSTQTRPIGPRWTRQASYVARAADGYIRDMRLEPTSALELLCCFGHGTWPPPNIQLGVSVENQNRADERVPHLLMTPAAARFASYEPALGPLDAWDYIHDLPTDGIPARLDGIIAGGESGPGARPSHPDWFRNLCDQCREAGVPFFFKAWGEWSADGSKAGKAARSCVQMPDGGRFPTETNPPEDMERALANGGQWRYRVGRKHSGRLLDGRTHDGLPICTNKERDDVDYQDLAATGL